MVKQHGSDTLAGSPSNQREILPGLVLSNDRPADLLADEGVRGAVARAKEKLGER